MITETVTKRPHVHLYEQPARETTPEFPSIVVPIDGNENDRTKYLEYIDSLGLWVQSSLGRISQKHKAQLLLQHENIGDPKTILVAGTNRDDQELIAQSLINQGEIPVWIGTCIGNDMSDQQAPLRGREHAQFWRGVFTMSDWDALQPQLHAYARQHPELILKMFPQGKQYSIGRLLTTENGLVIQVKLNQLDGRDDQKVTKKLITIEINQDPFTKKITTIGNDDPDTSLVIDALSSSRSVRYFKTLQKAAWRLAPTLSLLNPEFMLDLDQNSIAFFTDLVWGTNPTSNTEDLPDIAQLISQAARGHIKPSPKHEASTVPKSSPEDDGANKKIEATINLDDLRNNKPSKTKAFRHFYLHQD